MPPSAPAVSVIIPVYNQWTMTRRCLAALAGRRAGADFEVLVVDNGSSDETPDKCPAMGRGLFGEAFRYIAPGANLNFGPGCNLGAAEAAGERLFFLNNDTTVTDDWAAPLLDAVNKGAGAAGPLLLFPDAGGVQHLGISFHVGFKAAHLHSRVPGGHALAKKRRELQAITGAALMIPKTLFAGVGGFFEGYANGCEDIELCCRVRLKGFAVTCAPESVVYHVAGASEGRYEREAANYRLLRARCGDSFKPDFHSLAAADGYELRLAENLDEYLAVPADRAAEHAKSVGGFDETRCREIIESEVYWQEGYELLARRLEASGALEEALLVRYRQSLFTPTRAALVRLLVLADKLGLSEAAAAAKAGVEEMARQAADAERMQGVARAHAEFYRTEGEERLAGLFEQRLGEMS